MNVTLEISMIKINRSLFLCLGIKDVGATIKLWDKFLLGMIT